MQFTAIFDSDPLEESFPPDVPITEIEVVAPTTMAGIKLPPTEPRVLSANPVREIISVNDAPVGPDIHDASRAKIVIRPRCKEYVEKQKQKPASIRTLACFSTSPSKNSEDNADLEEIKDETVRPVAPSSSSSSTKTMPSVPQTPKKARVPPTGPRAHRTPTATTRIHPQPLIPRALATPRRRAVSTGRIEKLPRSRTPSPPRPINASQLDLGSPLPSFATPDYELQACPCSMPADCQTCTLRRLVDECVLFATRTSPVGSHFRFGVARDYAKLDRYDIIRTFFTSQATLGQRRTTTISWPEQTRPFSLAQCRHFHSSRISAADEKPPPHEHDNDKATKSEAEETKPEPTPTYYDNYSPFFRRLAMSLPHLPRPSRDDFLKVATGFWARARIRFKWFTIKSFRPFNADDISAFVTWFVMSQTLWIFVGTTTFFSVVFATANSLSLQEYIARGISDYLTAETGVTVIFESAIVPKWKDSRISFKNVFISRRPRSVPPPPRGPADWEGEYHRVTNEDESTPDSEEDINYTMFDLNVDSIDVTLSLWRWLDGKGLIQDAVIKGVRGIIDRRSVHWDPENPPDPALFRHSAHAGDFELESMQIEDLLVTVYQPDGFRPYTASIFQADIKTFRKQWIFYDFLCAENIVGQFDNCLFSLHKPQSIGRTTEMDLKDGDWGRMSRLRIDGVNIDHIQRGTTTDGPISWITSGKVDAVLDIKFPRNPSDELQLTAVLGELADAIFDPILERIPAQRGLAKPPLQAPTPFGAEKTEDESGEREETPRLVIDIDLRFRDLKAAVPLFTNDLSYVNYALVRPIVSFMNANRTLVPIRCRVIKDVADFDGSWTVYDAMAYHVTQANMNRRIRTVSLWSLQMTAGALVSTLRTMVDPVSARVREAYLNGRGLYEDSLLLGPVVDF
ncbi:mitochondrial distribution and morphology proteins-domain-containing protein [Favolaschia claudopus]|uniref:Mitochondrial distribution and morphology proteins-domain-containing protein n=1 Tax=Favolaschia claudopus TaxID=2862362 RepID=A0AAW0A2C5_9AGAR